MHPRFLAFATLAFVAGLAPALASADDAVTRKRDVIYGRKFGLALTMDVFQPTAKPNGLGVIFVVSGGFYSNHEAINPGFVSEFYKRGYTVFCVVHGSQPKFTIPEIVADMQRSVRFIRANAAEYKIDPERLGVTGASAGGHLSCMLGAASTAGDPKAKDPIDRQSSRVNAVACFFPPTDFLNYGKTGNVALGDGILKDFPAPFDFADFDPKAKRFIAVTDREKRIAIAKRVSPVYHASADDPPTLIIHGDADELVPIQQAELMLDGLKKVGVPTKLVVRKGAGHGWVTLLGDLKIIADWFDEHLKPAPAAAPAAGK